MDTAALVFAQIPGWSVAGIALQRNTLLPVAGLAVLGGALLVLLFRRWGRSRPLAKCVALSVFAHILLLASACGVQLFPDTPRPGSGSGLSIDGRGHRRRAPADRRTTTRHAARRHPARNDRAVRAQNESGANNVPQPPPLPDLAPQMIEPPALAEAPVETAAPSEPPELLPGPPVETPSAPAPAPPTIPPIAEQLVPPNTAEPQRLPVAETTPAPRCISRISRPHRPPRLATTCSG